MDTTDTTQAPEHSAATSQGEELTLDLDPTPPEATAGATEATAGATEKAAEPAPEPELEADSSDTPSEAAPKAPAHQDDLVPDRRRIEEQLEQLKRRESELRRELAIADHPELAEAIRQLEGAAYCVSRADAKLAQGLTKSEEKRRDTLSKKIAAVTEKRDKLDAQLAELQAELAGLGEDRIQGFEAERREAMQRLVAALGAHTAALKAADLDAAELLPQIGGWMDEIRALAEELAAQR